jgi:hypothetical protein
VLPDVAPLPQARDQDFRIIVGGEVIRIHHRGRERIGRSKPDFAAALRPQAASVQRHAIAVHRRARVIDYLRRNEMVLDVGVGRAKLADRERAGLGDIAGARPGAVEQKFHRHADRSKPAILAIEGRAALGALQDVDIEMILQVLADARQIMHRRNAARPQLLGRTDAGQEQQLRR